MTLQNAISRITDILRRDDGISGAMHYTEQISWILFLKFLSDYEATKADEALLASQDYEYTLDEAHQWETWACPKDENGKIDLKTAKSGDDLKDYVNNELFPYLKSFRGSTDPTSLRYRIGAIFEYLDNRIASGHTLREVLDIVDQINFQSSEDLFEMSKIYEDLLKGMGSDGGNSGEFYTPRAVIRAMVEVVAPQVGQTVYDAAAGSCGFLIEAFDYMMGTGKDTEHRVSTEQYEFLQSQTFYGNEKTPLAYTMGMMNMILHGIERPNLTKRNTLTTDVRTIEESDRYDIILANPPFGGKEKPQIQQNFPVKANATELLFLQHFTKSLKVGGKAAIIVPEGVLFQGGAFASVKKDLLENFNLHTILSLPAGVFLPYSGVKTNVIFFDRAGSTQEVWYYECDPGRKLTKNNPISAEDLTEFVELFATRPTTEKSWTVDVETRCTVSQQSTVSQDYDLSAKNPSKAKEVEHRSPAEILVEIRAGDKKIEETLDRVESLLKK